MAARAVLTEDGDFKRFSSARNFTHIGLTPGGDSSGDDRGHFGITKPGNCHVRSLLVEAAQRLESSQKRSKQDMMEIHRR